MCAFARKKGHQGFSLLELVGAIAIVAVFAGVLLQRLLYVQEQAEMTAMHLTVAHIRTGLRYKIGDFLIRDRVSEIATLADENPINWLDRQPDNYFGEFQGLPQGDLRGKWYFDRSRRELVYTINNRRHFLPARDNDYTLRWHADRVRGTVQAGSVGADNQQWVALVPVAGGRWF